MQKTKIEYITHSWNPIAMRCTPVSEGCERCWHLDVNKRLNLHSGPPELREKELGAPAKLKKPARIGVQFMGDLFHEAVREKWQHAVFNIVDLVKRHTYIFLTKRPEKLLEIGFDSRFHENVWLGVTCENQQRADERIPILLQIPAVVRFVSIEPMLGPVNLTEHYSRPDRSTNLLTGIPYDYDYDEPMLDDKEEHLDWVICGGESGPRARPMHPDWVRSIRDQCVDAGMPFFFKQWGEYIHGSGLPEDEPLNAKTWKWAGEGKTAAIMGRVGKKAAGRLLDGREHSEYPATG